MPTLYNLHGVPVVLSIGGQRSFEELCFDSRLLVASRRTSQDETGTPAEKESHGPSYY
jgi:hypothetical protein